MDEMLFPANHIPCLEACSDRLYHKLVTRDRPGLIVVSKTPSRTRRATIPAKSDAAPWHATTTAHVRLEAFIVSLGQEAWEKGDAPRTRKWTEISQLEIWRSIGRPGKMPPKIQNRRHWRPMNTGHWLYSCRFQRGQWLSLDLIENIIYQWLHYSKDCSIAKRGFIKVLKHVGSEHKREKTKSTC
jgi:hypothetical protein